jgi:hypothetical protein
MFGIVVKGTKDLLRVEVANGPDDEEMSHGPTFCLTQEESAPYWLVGNYDKAAKIARPREKNQYRKSWMFDEYESPDHHLDHLTLEVVEVTLNIK